MSYGRHSGLGVDWDAVLQQGKDIWESAQPAVQAGMAIVEDPYLPQVACEVLRLNKIQEGRPPGPRCPKPINPKPNKGVGLVHAVKPLQAFVYARQNPWVVPAAVLGVVGISFGVGYWAGKRKRR